MTAAQHTIHYDLSTRDDFERLLAEMHNTEPETIVIAFSPTSSLSPTDLEFARLVATAKDCGKRLVAETNDHRLANRALMHGFNHSAVVSDAPQPAQHDTNTIAPVIVPADDVHSRLENLDTTANLATYTPRHEDRNVQPPHEEDQTTNGSAHTTAAPASDESQSTEQEPPEQVVHASHVDQDLTTPIETANGRRQPRAVTGQTVNEDDGESQASHGRSNNKPRPQRRKAMILAAAVVAPVLVLAIVGALVLYLLPTAHVSLTPEEDPISSSLTYGVAVGDASFDVAVDPSPLSNSTSAEATRETTGERFEPDGTAAGAIRITNPFTSEVTVPAGTDIAGPNGMTYYTSEDAIIPAADPFGSLSFGSGTVGVYAGAAGPDGNLDAGSLTGQLGNGLFYSNQEAISGGTLRRIQTITEEDVAAVEDEVRTQLLDRAEEEFLASVPEGFELVPNSMEIGEPEIEVTGEAGSDGTEISASGIIEVRGQIFNPEDLHARAQEEASRLLASKGGNDRILLANSVSVGDPTSLDSSDTSFRIEANATVRKVITVEEQEQLVDQLVGLSREDAEQIIAEHSKVADYELTIEPDWLPDKLPEIASRIDVQVSSGEQTTANR